MAHRCAEGKVYRVVEPILRYALRLSMSTPSARRFSRPIARFTHGGRIFARRVVMLIRQPIFITLTVLVHSCVLVAAILFYRLEAGTNLAVNTLFDAVYWAMCTITTVGYGDIVPLTAGGRMIAMILMIFGSLATVLYTALFATAVVAPEFQQVERQIHKIEADFRRITEE